MSTYTDNQVRAAINNTVEGKVVDTVRSIGEATATLGATDNKLLVAYSVTGAVTVTIPSAEIAITGRKFSIIDSGGLSATNNITVVTEGAETIDGAATKVLATNYGVINLVSGGTNVFSC